MGNKKTLSNKPTRGRGHASSRQGHATLHTPVRATSSSSSSSHQRQGDAGEGSFKLFESIWAHLQETGVGEEEEVDGNEEEDEEEDEDEDEEDAREYEEVTKSSSLSVAEPASLSDLLFSFKRLEARVVKLERRNKKLTLRLQHQREAGGEVRGEAGSSCIVGSADKGGGKSVRQLSAASREFIPSFLLSGGGGGGGGGSFARPVAKTAVATAAFSYNASSGPTLPNNNGSGAEEEEASIVKSLKLHERLLTLEGRFSTHQKKVAAIDALLGPTPASWQMKLKDVADKVSRFIAQQNEAKMAETAIGGEERAEEETEKGSMEKSETKVETSSEKQKALKSKGLFGTNRQEAKRKERQAEKQAEKNREIELKREEEAAAAAAAAELASFVVVSSKRNKKKIDES